MALMPEGFLDGEGKYASINTNCVYDPIPAYNLEYLAGILNSKLINFVYSELFAGLKMGGGYFQFQAPQLRILPIASGSDTEMKALSSLVSKLMTLYKSSTHNKTKLVNEQNKVNDEINDIENKINDAVYGIYGINKSERKIIEESLK